MEAFNQTPDGKELPSSVLQGWGQGDGMVWLFFRGLSQPTVGG